MSTQLPSPVSPELADARDLAARRDWVALAARLAGVGDDAFAAEPELGFLYADACRRTGDTGAALRVGARVEPVARRSGDRWLVVNVVNLLGMTLFESGRVAEAEARFDELLEVAADWGDDDFAARAANNLGAVANIRGRRDLALTQYQRALAGYTRTGNQRGLAQTHYNVGISYRDLGFDREADASFRRAVDFAQATGTEEVVAMAETERAQLRARGGDPRLAAEMARRARERFERLGDPIGVAEATRVLASAARAESREAEALELLDAALQAARAHSDPLLCAEVQRDRGLLLRDVQRADEARAALVESADNFESLGSAAEAEAVRAILAGLSTDS